MAVHDTVCAVEDENSAVIILFVVYIHRKNFDWPRLINFLALWRIFLNFFLSGMDDVWLEISEHLSDIRDYVSLKSSSSLTLAKSSYLSNITKNYSFASHPFTRKGKLKSVSVTKTSDMYGVKSRIIRQISGDPVLHYFHIYRTSELFFSKSNEIWGKIQGTQYIFIHCRNFFSRYCTFDPCYKFLYIFVGND